MPAKKSSANKPAPESSLERLSRRNSVSSDHASGEHTHLSAEADEKMRGVVADVVREQLDASLAEALGPIMQQLASSSSPAVSSKRKPARRRVEDYEESGEEEPDDMMQQLFDMVSSRLTQLEKKPEKPPNRHKPVKQRYFSDRLDDDENDSFEDEDGRVAPHVLSMLDKEHSAVAWVRVQRCWDNRSLKEALQWASFVDAFRSEGLPLSSVSLEIALRRLVGLHLSNKHSNWELAEVLEWSGESSLLSRGQLSRVIKEANARAAMAKRASGGKKTNPPNDKKKRRGKSDPARAGSAAP
jgi:hypothetical protein